MGRKPLKESSRKKAGLGPLVPGVGSYFADMVQGQGPGAGVQVQEVEGGAVVSIGGGSGPESLGPGAGSSGPGPALPGAPIYIDIYNEGVLKENNIKEDNNSNRLADNQIDSDNSAVDITAKIDTKAGFNPREIKFLSLYFSGKYGKAQSARLSGYKGNSTSSLINSANMVLRKYDSKVGVQDSARAMGAGESSILMKLLHIAENSDDEKNKLQALNILSKCLGMQSGGEVAGAGAEIIITVDSGARVQGQEGAAGSGPVVKAGVRVLK